MMAGELPRPKKDNSESRSSANLQQNKTSHMYIVMKLSRPTDVKKALIAASEKKWDGETKQCLQKSNNSLTADFSIVTVEAKALKNYIWEVLEENN